MLDLRNALAGYYTAKTFHMIKFQIVAFYKKFENLE